MFVKRMSLTIIIGLGAVSRWGDEQTNRELFMSFFERGDQHQIFGGSSKYVVLAFSVNQWNQEHECRGRF